MKSKILLFLGTIFFIVLTGCSNQKEKPNVLFILTDQWRASAVGYDGNPVVKTPDLDRFSEESVNFVNTVSVAPVCTPYRASLLTGKYPTSTGMFLNDIYLPSEEVCMAEIYKDAGYNTAYLGKWHLDGHGRLTNVAPERRQGFDFWKGLECSHDYNHMPYYENDDPEMKFWEGYSPFAISKEAQKYMEDHHNNDKPFLLFVSLATPHFPHHSAPEEYKDMYPFQDIQLPANVPDSLKNIALKEIQGYYAHCTATDKAIGELIQKTKDLEISDNTIIVFTSDHGEMMGSHGRLPFRKQLAFDESARVPFLISYPGIGKNKGTRMKAPITTPDILPSLLSLSDIEIPETIEGYDLSEMIKSPNPEADRAALFMNVHPFDVNMGDKEYRAIRTSRYTYARSPEGPFMLFDNENDPDQLNNLLDNSDFEKIQAELDKKLDFELERIGDKDFKPRDYYLEKFGLILNTPAKNNIRYNFEGEEHIVQSPLTESF